MAITPGQVAAARASNGIRSTPHQAASALELPAAPEELARDSAVRLGWEGVVLPQMSLFGRRVFIVAALRAEAHAERIAIGVGPVTDRTAVATWMWPELAAVAPPAAVRVTGVLAVARHWRTGLAATVPFSGCGEAALVLPSSVTLSHDYIDNCLPRARAHGVGVVAADEEAVAHLDLASRVDIDPFGENAISRWVNEMAYEQFLNLQQTTEVE